MRRILKISDIDQFPLIRIKTSPLLFLLFLCCTFSACDYFVKTKSKSPLLVSLPVNPEEGKAESNSKKNQVHAQRPLIISQTEQTIIDAGLINVATIDSSIVVDLKYSTKDNFLGIDVYGDFNKCYLQPDVAEKLKKSSLFLQSEFPYYRLLVYDAVRPRSIQYQMWDTIKVPVLDKSKYLSNPKDGSLHNYGAAVDISIIDEHGYVLDMGTSYDYFGELAFPRTEERMVKEGKLSYRQLFNRELLRKVMEQGGFFGSTTEWWHFNSCFRVEANAKYKIIE